MGTRILVLASEKILSSRVWVSWPSSLTRNVSCLTSSTPSVFSGLCGEQQVSSMRRKGYTTF